MDHQLSALHSRKSSVRLEQIAALRARGVGDHIDLPQLVVCGDQSSGKSSVLEGLTGLPFPRQDGICTRFGTEILLHHTDSEALSIIATLIPYKNREDATSGAMRAYHRRLERFEELPEVIKDVGSLMGLRGYSESADGPSFAEDVLRIEVTGPIGLHLSVVDLPGIILVPNEEQTEHDVAMVHSLVDKYIANPRTIILAVVQAGNDIANQSIIMKSRIVDPDGERTVGIITKPDLINEGSQKRIALLAKNQDTTKLKLGYFLLKNPTPKELESHISPQERKDKELAFFQSSPWKEQDLDMDRVGIRSLQLFLQQLLDQHIERELPKVRDEIRTLMSEAETRLESMGEERADSTRIRLFLTRLSMSFHRLTVAALNGGYHESDCVFFPHTEDLQHDSQYEGTRLRALIHQLNIRFAADMRVDGAKRKVVSKDEFDFLPSMIVKKAATDEQIQVTRNEMLEWVKEVRNAGLERLSIHLQSRRTTGIEARNCQETQITCFSRNCFTFSQVGGLVLLGHI